jgi:hypothetical protein
LASRTPSRLASSPLASPPLAPSALAPPPLKQGTASRVRQRSNYGAQLRT